MDIISPNIKIVTVEELGREILVKELSMEYIDNANKSEDYDTMQRALTMCTDMTEAEYKKLGFNTCRAIYNIVIDLTYPGVREAREKEIEDGTYTPMNDDETEDLKKK